MAVAAGLAVASSGVYAQSNATGNVYGTVTAAAPGSVVVVENLSTGAKRTATPDASGHYQLTALPPGNYKVSLMKGDALIGTQNVEVLIGAGAEATFASAGNTLETVQVTGTRRLIDAQATNSVSTFTAKQLANLPIGQDLTSIILLAPDTVKADPRYAGGASIGGGAPSENSYYIDGFPVTNALSQLGSIELPFGAISQANVLTGGFGAEFGRSTGGVMNIVTKSGGNKWEGGAFAYMEPDALRSTYSNIYYANTGVINSKTGKPFDGTLNTYNAANTKSQYKYGGYLGGPIVQDKLFLFAAVDQTRDRETGIGGTTNSSTLGLNGWTTSETTNNRWLAKLDWQINDDHRVTLMNFGDNYSTDANYYSFNYATLQPGTTSNYSGHYVNQPNVSPAVGGYASLLRYTGNLTENLVLTAVLGEAKSTHVQRYGNFASGINLNVPGSVVSGAGAAPGLNYNSPNPLTAQDLPTGFAQDTTKSGRLDVEWTLGSHTVRAGIDKVKLSSDSAGQVEAGGGTWSFRKTGKPTSTLTAGPYTFQVSDGVAGSLASQGYYVRKHVFSDVTNATSDQDAEYIEDKWQVTKKLFLQMGLRDEGFSGASGAGATYLKSKNFISPRLAGAYDVYGDSGLTLKGSLGRYSIQTPTHLAVRGAGVSTLTYQYYRYTGIDANGQPTGLTALTPAPFSPDGETGQVKDSLTYAAHDLKPSYQDELRLGFDKALSPTLVGSFMLTYRKLGATLDDYCGTAFDNYADAHHIDRTNYAGEGGCFLINPGRNNTFLVDYAGTRSNYTTVTLTPQDINFPEKPKRTFLALDFSLEHPFSNGWYGKITYTWSQNKGNTEGQTKSDIGQTDVSATETWDFPQLMEGANGFLPNDRTHQIHAFGYFQVSPELMVGGNMTAQSGRPKNCFGNYGGTNPDGDPGYGSAFFYCSTGTSGTLVFAPRGSQGRLPWDVNFDINAVYRPAQFKGLSLRADVFNVFNKQTVQAINETHENDGDPTSLLSSYGMPISYSAPRAVRFTAQYEF
ncbi:MAG: TonB-dependent receptor [Paucibacter sp.]|nr:TonB-dependent receptor [Roseateles sp.]